jgi:UDP:flavonoid glycosyltransferase YjiC (YdhE family)
MFGSWGDLFPMMPVALGLKGHGHSVSVAATLAAQELVEAEGLQFWPTGPRLGFEEYSRHPEILDSRFGGLMGLRNLLRLFAFPRLEQTFRDLEKACEGADLLVTHPVQLASPMVAEASGIRWVTLSVFPGLVPSAWTVPQVSPLPALPTSAGRMINRGTWSAARVVTRRLFDGRTNAVRKRVRLPPQSDVLVKGATSPHLALLLTSPRYTPPAPDWPPQVIVTGFTTWDRSKAMAEPPGLDDYLSSGPPPVVLTLGASLSIDPRGFFETAAGALELAGVRGIFLVGREENVRALGNRPGVFAYVPLSRVLPDAPAVVHHGGFGTTSAALEAGTPQVVVPRAFDQLYHAKRVQQLGLGRAIDWKRLGVERLAKALRRVLADDYLRRTRDFAAALNVEDGPARAVSEIERLL